MSCFDWVEDIELFICVLCTACRTSEYKHEKEMHSADRGYSSLLVQVDRQEKCIKILPSFLVV